MKFPTRTVCIAVALFLWDAFLMGGAIVALYTFLVCALILFPRALWGLRSDRQVFRERGAKACIYLLSVVAAFAVSNLQSNMADSRAIKIGNACLTFHAKYERYPRTLNELVPGYLPYVPVAKYTVMYGDFSYAAMTGEPMLYYVAMPPFGRRFYHMEKGSWGFLD